MRTDPPRVFCVDLNLGLTMGGFAALMRDPQFEADTALLAIATPMQFHLVGAGVPVRDLIVPPFDPDELRLRVERILGSVGETIETGVLRRSELAIDQDRYTVRLGGEVVDLTYKEYELLRFLALNPGKAFTREMLLNQVWGYELLRRLPRTVDVHVRRIPRQDRAARAVHRDGAQRWLPLRRGEPAGLSRVAQDLALWPPLPLGEGGGEGLRAPR